MIGCPITHKMFNEPERRLFLITYFIIAYKIGCAWLHKHLTSTFQQHGRTIDMNADITMFCLEVAL